MRRIAIGPMAVTAVCAAWLTAVPNLAAAKQPYRAADREGSPPSSARGDRPEKESLAMENRHLQLQWHVGTQTFSLTHKATGRTFVTAGKLPRPGGKARVVDVGNQRFGAGKAVEIAHDDGSADRLMLYSDVPFLLLQTTQANTGGQARIVRKLVQADIPIDFQRPAAGLRALGTAGLTAPDGHSGSYVFLAVADPQTRHGVVGAYLTHDRGSGIVFSSMDHGLVRMKARIDYGRLLIPPGKKAKSEIFAFGWFGDARLGLERWADLVARWYDIHLRPQPDGYCTWYSRPHGGASDQQHLVQLAEFASRELKPVGLDFIQIDDKWQDGQRRNGPAKIFCRHNPQGPYRDGMKPVADRVRALGLTPGIWFMPFAGDRQDPFFADKQDWFLQQPDGSPYFVRWGGTCLDMTRPEARTYVAELADRLAREWGYKYFKMDGLWTGIGAKLLYVNNAYKPDDLGQPRFHCPEVTPIEAYRSGLKLVRKAAGEDVFFLGCCVSQNMRSFGASLGLVDAMRIGPDNGPGFEALKRGPWHGSNRYFLHGRVWYNDPDPVYVRPSLPLRHARLICSWVAVTGQMNVSSEWLPGLPPERLDLLRRTLPNHHLRPRPVDLLENELPRIWLLADQRDNRRRYVVGLFNWDDQHAARIECSLDRLGLPAADAYVGFDYWKDQFVPPFSATLGCDLPAGTARVLALRPVADHPQVVSTSRHITQGVVDLVSEKWDAASGVLSGVSRVVAHDPYRLRIVTGAVDRCAGQVELVGDAAQGTKTIVKQDGGQVRVTIVSPGTGKVGWKIRFAGGKRK